jgi:Ca2+-binding RTX toxin-like protein
VVFGKSGGAKVDLTDVENGSGGFVINGVAADDRAGGSVSSAGDVNGDGLADILVGAKNDDPNGADSGAAFVVYGKNSTGRVELSDVDNGTGGFAIRGVGAGDQAGVSVSAAGDLNGDGVGDLIVGAYHDEPNGADSGAAFVIFGGAQATATATSTTVLDGTTGNDNVTGGDTAEILFGRDGADSLNGGGGADVLYGNKGLDLILGGEGADIVFGGQNAGALSLGEGSTTALRDGVETLSGGGGDDILYGNHGSDLIYGGRDGDALFGGQEGDSLFGNNGDDTLGGNRGNDFLEGGAGADLFRFSTNGGADTISDFSVAEGDRISAATTRLSVVDSASGALISFDGGYTVALTGVSASEVTDGFFS